MDLAKKKKPRVVIVGAGFGGIKAAQLLAKEDIDLTIVDRHNFHLFQPLLYQIATSELSENEIAYPVRAFFAAWKNVHFLMAQAERLDAERQVVLTNYGEVPYDYLLIAAGATTNFFGIEGVRRYSYGMKTLQEAISIRNHVLHMFERAVRVDDPALRRQMLTFVCVGGGPTGIESAGALSELIYGIMRQEYHSLDFNDIHVILVEAMSSILTMMPEALQKETLRVLTEKRQVKVLLNKQVTDYDGKTLTLKDGTSIPTQTVIWAAGVKAVPFMGELGAPTDRSGRVVVDEFLRVGEYDNVFALGDCAAFRQDGELLTTIAPVAIQQAEVFAKNLKKILNGNHDLKAFHYNDVGAMATICRGHAVVKMPGKNGSEWRGLIAWFMWMVVHLMRLAGFYTNITVAMKWIWNFFMGVRIGRVITNMRTEETMRF